MAESLEFHESGFDGPYINYLEKHIKGKIISPYTVEIDNDLIKGYSYCSEDHEQLVVVAHEHQILQDFKVDVHKTKNYDYLIALFFNGISFMEGEREVFINTPKGFIFLKGDQKIRINQKKGITQKAIVFQINKSVFSPIVIEKLEKINTYLYHSGNKLTTDWYKGMIKGLRHEILPQYKEKWYNARLRLLLVILENTLEKFQAEEDQLFFLDHELAAVQRIRYLITENLKVKPKLKELAKEYGIQSTKLTNIFKELYGQTLYKFYNEQRLLKVKEELENTNKTLTTLAYEYQFSDVNHLSKSYIGYFGVKPSEYRK
ncbi:helix-turn-helix transcriptional regulator [Flammeovirga agarivorans]|uniref:Helix-turn-helix transcriptional regulator n=1 Tax=Flammeovirga agarivorans TaxID=2726742 RepID=A0A7X8XY26_9BACT|nr:helix-turn-helix transcriptional regulator [Flammeovirga agarivorans]NLR93635.1 helix-turn-helix transcriptional regulator [Flammeovirga agarivorans]